MAKNSGDLWGAPHWGCEDYGTDEVIMVLDPVCGTPVDEARCPASVEYAGEKFRFCSTDCRIKFEEHPGYYIGQTTGKR